MNTLTIAKNVNLKKSVKMRNKIRLVKEGDCADDLRDDFYDDSDFDNIPSKYDF